jgi:hypothetical protein
MVNSPVEDVESITARPTTDSSSGRLLAWALSVLGQAGRSRQKERRIVPKLLEAPLESWMMID